MATDLARTPAPLQRSRSDSRFSVTIGHLAPQCTTAGAPLGHMDQHSSEDSSDGDGQYDVNELGPPKDVGSPRVSMHVACCSSRIRNRGWYHSNRDYASRC